MKLVPTKLAGVMVAHTTAAEDARGTFTRFFCERDLAEAIGQRKIVQANGSRTSTIGSVRGLHYQRAPHAEMKLVRCLRGRVWDVAVDLRAGSPTLLQWHAEELSPENLRMLVVPEGCAHGFQVLEAPSELLYLHTACYDRDAESGVRCDDPRLAIAWPLPVADRSERDRLLPLLGPDFHGIET